MTVMKEVAELQEQYQELIDSKRLSKKALCELCIPFRDRYKLTDSQTLQIARGEMSMIKMTELLEAAEYG